MPYLPHDTEAPHHEPESDASDATGMTYVGTFTRFACKYRDREGEVRQANELVVDVYVYDRFGSGRQGVLMRTGPDGEYHTMPLEHLIATSAEHWCLYACTRSFLLERGYVTWQPNAVREGGDL
jgi:hypothetical protein